MQTVMPAESTARPDVLSPLTIGSETLIPVAGCGGGGVTRDGMSVVVPAQTLLVPPTQYE